MKVFVLVLLVGAASGITVKTEEGLVRGTTRTSLFGRDFLSFQGIPYAEPPVGPLRYKPARKKSHWDGVLDATSEGSICPQHITSTEEYAGEEDCLFLNVYTHHNAEDSPVIVWYHGGAFIEGEGGVELSGPDLIMDQDIVFVTFNYRLGPLGFLSTGDAALPGNYGLKDAVEVLRWVKRNIKAFGGNPDLVTVYGYSSGAACAHSLIFSPLTKGLLHRVIYQSGSALHNWGFKHSPIDVARKVADLVGCPSTKTSTDIAECLRQQPAEKLVRTLYKFPYWVVKLPLPYAPVVETQEDEDDPPFLLQPPETLVKSGSFHQIPAMTGVVAEESLVTPLLITRDTTLAEEFDRKFDVILRTVMSAGNISDEAVRKVRKFYLGLLPANKASLTNLVALFSDAMFNHRMYRGAKQHAAASTKPVYVYLFTFQGRLSELVRSNMHHEPLGVMHADDLFYVLQRGTTFPGGKPNAAEVTTIRRVTKMLADFARTGNPTPETSELIPEVWQSIGSDNHFQYLDIGADLKLHSGPLYPKRIRLWESLIGDEEETVKDEL